MLKIWLPALLLSAILPQPALAQKTPTVVRVAHHDLNLRSPAGVRMLDRRIRRAIEAVCPDAGSGTARNPAVARCRAARQAEVADQRAAVLNAPRGIVELAAARAVR